MSKPIDLKTVKIYENLKKAPSTDNDVLVVNLCNKSALAENGAAIKSITIGKNFFMP